MARIVKLEKETAIGGHIFPAGMEIDLDKEPEVWRKLITEALNATDDAGRSEDSAQDTEPSNRGRQRS